jgi:predicted transcriptional regulator of viral defense system
MACSDIPGWYLRRRLAVVDLGTATWRKARSEVVPKGYAADECMARLIKAGHVRRVGRGLFVVIDPMRETAPIAIASALFAEETHYVTTDGALAFHGAVDQPIRRITVVQSRRRRSINIGTAVVWPVRLRADRLLAADAYETTTDGFKIRVATREQAVVDALAEPGWMVHIDLLAEVLASFTEDELKHTAEVAVARSTAAAQRLGYLLEDAGRDIPSVLRNLQPTRAVKLRPRHKAKGPYSTRWRVYG